MYDPKDDGITHINIYSKGNTLLGRFLSNFHRSEINTPLGKFQSIEGLIYYMGSFDEKLRTLSGHQAKDAGKLLDRQIRLPEDIFKRIIKESMWRKLTSDGQMVGMLKSSTLPLTHYYVYGKYLWAYGEWDSSYSLGLLELNLRRLQRICRNGSSKVPRSRDRRMSIAIECLKRMQDPFDHYTLPAMNAFDKRWNFTDDFEFLDHPDDITDPIPMGKRVYTTRSKFRDSLPDKVKARYDKEYKEQVLDIENKMWKRDTELFCKIFQKDVRTWWD